MTDDRLSNASLSTRIIEALGRSAQRERATALVLSAMEGISSGLPNDLVVRRELATALARIEQLGTPA